MAETAWERLSPWLFLVGLVVFGGSILLFVADVIRQVDVFRGIAVNAAGAVLLITWAAHDTLSDPDSEVATVGGAAGTALLFYGIYLLGAGVVISVTGLWHEYLLFGLLYLPLAVLAVVVGYLIFPTETVIDEEGSADGTDGASGNGTADDG